MSETENTTESSDEIEVLCKNIQNPERLVKQDALKKLHHLIQNAELTEEEIVKYFDVAYLYILKCYSDKYEMCRSLASLIINEFVEKLPNNEYYLECILPAITRRIGQSEIIEECEELRLDLMNQLYDMVLKYSGLESSDDRLLKSYNNIIDILLKTLRDPFPAVQRKACSLVVLFSCEKCFHYRAEILVTPLIDMLRHRHFSNRIAAIEALAHVALNIHTNGDCLMRIITEISPLLMDNMAHVRRECGRAGCLLLLKLRDRYSFFDKLLPLVLCCLSDEHQEVVSDIEKRWDKCGELYYEENENELSKQSLVDDLPESYDSDNKRPTLGCRAIVQKSLKVINVILHEMEDWKDEVRQHSTKLLYQVILHCEKAMTAKTLDILPVLAKTCMDPEPIVSAEALRVANLMGQILNYNDWITYSLDDLNVRPNVGNIRCLTNLYTGSSAERSQGLEKICGALKESRVIFNIKAEHLREIFTLLDILLIDYQHNKCSRGDEVAELEKIFYHLIMNVIGISMESSIFTNEECRSILSKLNLNVSNLHERYLSDVVDAIEGLDCLNSNECEPILLLNGYLKFTGFHSYSIKSIEKALNLVLTNAQPDAKIRILTAMAMAMLEWNIKSETSLDESIQLLQTFMETLLVPCLTWNVGRNCEAIRSMATACLCAISENAVDESFIILPKIIANILPLIEDNNIATRNYAVRSLINCGPIPAALIKQTAIAIVSRLDDPSPDVRHGAALLLGNLKVCPVEDDDEWKMGFVHIFSIAVHHLDDPDVRLKDTLFNSLFELADRNETQFNELMESPKFSKFKKLNEICVKNKKLEN